MAQWRLGNRRGSAHQGVCPVHHEVRRRIREAYQEMYDLELRILQWLGCIKKDHDLAHVLAEETKECAYVKPSETWKRAAGLEKTMIRLTVQKKASPGCPGVCLGWGGFARGCGYGSCRCVQPSAGCLGVASLGPGLVVLSGARWPLADLGARGAGLRGYRPVLFRLLVCLPCPGQAFRWPRRGTGYPVGMCCVAVAQQEQQGSAVCDSGLAVGPTPKALGGWGVCPLMRPVGVPWCP